jgi:drug/metabolite transporter (DMT)-like permease
VLLGTLLLGEPFGWRIVLAAGLVFAGIAVVRSKPALAHGAGAVAQSRGCVTYVADGATTTC